MKQLLTTLLLGMVTCCATAQDRYELNSGWRYATIDQVKLGGAAVSAPGYRLTGWKTAIVPGTVLTNMLHHKAVPDPFFGMNNERIPDIYHTGRAHYTAWFVKDFREAKPVNGRQVWLDLRGVNYSCDVYLNGRKLNAATHHGMFLRQSYNITSLLANNGNNRLAIIVYPPDPVGNPNGGQGGDGRIAKNVSTQYVAGWDWIQPIRDRNTGIWDKVFIERTGAVNLRNPHIITLVPGVRSNTGPQQPATIQMSAELENASDRTVTGTLQYQLDGEVVSTSVRLAPNSTTLVQLPDASLRNPRLWWPAGYGRQDLYNTELQFVEAGKVTDRESLTYGVRAIQRVWNTTTSSSEFRVNGQPVFIKGGNWIISDAMLRLSEDRYDAEIRHHRDMHLNLIRIWGGALLERPEFYKACDKYGLLVFQDFWMSGDCNGRWLDPKKTEDQATRRLYPDDHGLFLRSVEDGVKLIRNHPSLAIWCGGNEIVPPDDILRAMRDTLLPRLDGTRVFFDYSNSDSMSLNTLGGNGDGPYNIQPPDTFWKHRTWPFNSEVGSVGLGDYASLQRFLPQEHLQQWPVYTPAAGDKKEQEKADSVWEYHKYIGYKQYIAPYGPVKDVRDFALKAQIVNYDQYRALAEGFSAQMWNWYTGYIIWKTQNPWTALRGQMYDYYLDPNACLYGLAKGAEPLHIMYNPVAGNIMMVNNLQKPIKQGWIAAYVYTMDGKRHPLFMKPVDVAANSVTSFDNIKRVVDSVRALKGAFLYMYFNGYDGKYVTNNTYWLPDAQGQYRGLQELPQTAGRLTFFMNVRNSGKGKIEAQLSTVADSPIAFFNRVSLLHPVTKKRLLPVFYSDNYVTLMPGMYVTIQIDWKEEDYPAGFRPVVEVEGWNTPKISVVLPSPGPVK